jgi:hypothetical protein
LQEFLATYNYLFYELEKIKSNPLAPKILKDAVEIAIPALACWYGKTDRIPLYIIANSKFLSGVMMTYI